jgi:hypothetical protein
MTPNAIRIIVRAAAQVAEIFIVEWIRKKRRTK